MKALRCNPVAALHRRYYLIENGYCTAADVDNFAKMAFGPRMCVTGVIEQKDLSGLVTHAASQRGTPARLLRARGADRSGIVLRLL